ncbi:hypothetical protein [Streptomyces mirabilis]|uniref:hypothetical protein n=1 Tax=Streptomyces mirabilis TaxID=68239 RepID=UPI002B1CBFFC|nr:hypothetical protein [Streptomyces mirabilis]
MQANLYASWTSTEGFGMHWDDHDTVIVTPDAKFLTDPDTGARISWRDPVPVEGEPGESQLHDGDGPVVAVVTRRCRASAVLFRAGSALRGRAQRSAPSAGRPSAGLCPGIAGGVPLSWSTLSVV